MEAEFYNIQMWHIIFEKIGIAILILLAIFIIFWLFAKITYILAHRKNKKKKNNKKIVKTQKKAKKIDYVIENSDKMYLFDIIEIKKTINN